MSRIEEISPTLLESALPDPPANGGAVRLEDLLQMPHRNVMRGSDHRRIEARIRQVILDERTDPNAESRVPRFERQAVGDLQLFGKCRGEHIEDRVVEMHRHGGRGIEDPLPQILDERSDQRAYALAAGDPPRRELGYSCGRDPQQLAREHHDQHPEPIVERELIGPRRVVDREVTRVNAASRSSCVSTQ